MFTVEENVLQGGFGTAVLELFEEEGIDVAVTRFGYPDRYLEQGEQPDLRAACGLDAQGIAEGHPECFEKQAMSIDELTSQPFSRLLS